jgi:hypothetical protein
MQVFLYGAELAAELAFERRLCEPKVITNDKKELETTLIVAKQLEDEPATNTSENITADVQLDKQEVPSDGQDQEMIVETQKVQDSDSFVKDKPAE